MSQADKKPYNCNICDRRFATEASLNHHVTKVGKATTNVTLKQGPGRRDSQSLLERVWEGNNAKV